MRALHGMAAVALAMTVPHAAAAANTHAETPAGTYDLRICRGDCAFGQPANVLVNGRIVLFAAPLAAADLQRFDENHLRHHGGEAINGCFTLEPVGKPSIYAGIEKAGLTTWSFDGAQFHFSLFHSPDAGYEASMRRTKRGLAGTGTSWGAGAGAPETPSTETVIARRTGNASITNCTFATAEEREFRRRLADPAREDVFAMEKAYRDKLYADLQISLAPRDWAMAGWLHAADEGDAQILRARETAPDDPLVRWLAVLRTRAQDVAVTVDGRAATTVQYDVLDATALAALQRAEPRNAAVWLMALRDAAHRGDDAAIDAALTRLASSTTYDDHASELLAEQLRVFRGQPLPDSFFAAVARLDAGWRLNGDFTRDVAPYYRNQYPFADIGVNNLFFLRVDSGIPELFSTCVRKPDRSAERKPACVAAARVLAAHARRADAREAGSMLLSEIGDFTADDVALARSQAWVASKYQDLVNLRLGRGHRPNVKEDIAFVSDWMQSSDENEAVRRAVERARQPLQPPPDFRFNRVLYGNFEKAQRRAEAPAQ